VNVDKPDEMDSSASTSDGVVDTGAIAAYSSAPGASSGTSGYGLPSLTLHRAIRTSLISQKGVAEPLFTDAECRYLRARPRGRLATMGPGDNPQVHPVSFVPVGPDPASSSARNGAAITGEQLGHALPSGNAQILTGFPSAPRNPPLPWGSHA
jgi:hypothetical protein